MSGHWWDMASEDLTEEMIREETAVVQFLAVAARQNAQTLTNLEKLMSDLTDKIDTALGVLATDETNRQAAIDAANAATAVVQTALDAANANDAINVAELQKALDALNAAHVAFSGGAVATPATPVTSPVVDPNAPTSLP